jgi:DNA topoisomerase-1
MNVVVVESPAKAKTINKYLGSEYKVLASFGHVRDLPAKDGSVLPDEDFAMSWEVDTASNKRLKDITEALKGADSLILATDPDREGEAISWHVLEVLNKKKALKDKPSPVSSSTPSPRSPFSTRWPIRARSTRRWSTPIWRAGRWITLLASISRPCCGAKLPGARSAGRVQSVALRLVCDRESEIERFVSEEYWQISADLKTPARRGLHRTADFA